MDPLTSSTHRPIELNSVICHLGPNRLEFIKESTKRHSFFIFEQHFNQESPDFHLPEHCVDGIECESGTQPLESTGMKSKTVNPFEQTFWICRILGHFLK